MSKQKHLEILDLIASSIGSTDSLEISDLKEASRIINLTTQYLFKRKVSRKEFNNIYEHIDNLIKSKLLNLNPTLSKEVLEKICTCYKRGSLVVPADITIVDDNNVFFLEHRLDKSGAIEETEIFLISGFKETDYKEINNFDYSFLHNCWDKKFNLNLAFGNLEFLKYFDKSKTEELVHKIVDYINQMLYPLFYNQVIFAGSDFNIDGYYYGLDTIFYSEGSKGAEIFLDLNLNQLMESIYKGESVAIKLIVVDDWNEFYCFDIMQTVSPDKTFSWSWEFRSPKTWNLERAISKSKKNTVSNNNSLVRKKESNN